MPYTHPLELRCGRIEEENTNIAYRKQYQMTLGDFFRLCAEHPAILLFLLIALPISALLAGILGKGEGHNTPWKYLYSVLVYLTCIPGVFAITLTVYLLLFEKQSIMSTNIYTQILPVISMILTLAIIRRNVSLELIPGFGKLSGLITVIAVVMIVFWILDRMRIFTITIVPFAWALVFCGVLILVAILGIRRMKK